MTIDRKDYYDADDMKVRTEGAQLVAIGKKLDAALVNGESIGFLRFTTEGAARFVGEVERIMRTPEGLKLWYLSVIHRIASESGDVGYRSIEGLGWGRDGLPARCRDQRGAGRRLGAAGRAGRRQPVARGRLMAAARPQRRSPDESIRMFEADWMEALSKIPYWVPMAI